MELDFSDQVAVVTGGASGIGEACAALLAGTGARVIVADRNEAAAQAVAEAIGGIALVLDVGEEQSVEALVAAVQARCGVPNVLVNSAGVLQRTLPPEELSLREWDFVARIDLRGTYLCCARFGAAMASARSRPELTRGEVLMIGSNIMSTCPPIRSCSAGDEPL